MAVQGYKSKLYASGSSTPFTAEPCTQIGSTHSYQINTAVKRILDRAASIVVYHNGGVTPVTIANIASIDPNYGIVTFISTFTVLGSVKIDASYLPIIAVADIRDISATLKATIIDTSVNGSSFKTKVFGQKDASGDFTGLDPFDTVINSGASSGDKTFWDWFTNETAKLLEFDPDGAGTMVLRTMVLFPGLEGKSGVDTIVNRKVMWESTMREFSHATIKGVKCIPDSFGAP